MAKAKKLAKQLRLTTETLRVLDGDDLAGVMGGDGPLSWFSACISNGKGADCRSAMGGRCDSTTPEGKGNPSRPWSVMSACISYYEGHCQSVGGDCRTKR